MKKRAVIGTIAYGAAFTLGVPLLLFAWARSSDRFITLRTDLPDGLGVAAVVLGSLLLLGGMVMLMVRGKGLPMNAYPPPLLVTSGPYRFLPHPIYTGFCGLVFGVSALFHSSAGLWLITPVTILGCVAIVIGYERHDLRERFGTVPGPVMSLPADSHRAPFLRERFSVIVLLFLPWLALYEMFIFLGNPAGAFDTALPFERTMPVVEWMEIFYLFTYLFVAAVPFLVRTSAVLRTFMIRGLVASSIVFLCYLTIPAIAMPRQFVPSTIFGELLQWERSADGASAALPSFHVVWAFIAAAAYARTFLRWRGAFYSIAVLIAFSCIDTGMHTVVDVAAGVIVAAASIRYRSVWNTMLRWTEAIANSWKEWRFGPLRVINHGAYTGLGSFAGIVIVGVLLGPSAVTAALIVAFASLIGAGLWAQFVEGSPMLLRPYGYYGGLFGGMIGCVIAQYTGTDLWLLLAAFGVAGPFIQAFGRLRCLVQGCCHGHPSSAAIGIRYRHPRSRVCRLSEWKDVPLHPTPLYSILWNIVCGAVLLRYWSLDLPPSFIAGMYLVLNGLGRFVEESFRGEPQTPILGDLRLYQLLSIGTVIGGVVLTMVPTAVPLPPVQFHWNPILAALIFGIITWFAQGADFPDSNKRFSRLV